MFLEIAVERKEGLNSKSLSCKEYLVTRGESCKSDCAPKIPGVYMLDVTMATDN